RHLEDWTAARRAHAARYDRLLRRVGVSTPSARPDSRHVYHIYAVRVPRRDALQQALQRQGIQTGIHYPTPVHLQPAHADLGYQPGSFPCAEQAAREVLSLPMFPELSSAQAAAVCTALRANLAWTPEEERKCA